MKLTCAIMTMLLFASAGCERSSSGSPAEPPLPRSIPGVGMIRGQVRFVGQAPAMQAFSANEACCKGEPPLVEESVVVNTNGTLRNVFVYLAGAPRTDGSARHGALLDQVKCRYVPHVLGIQAGQALRIRSSDPTMHNVHFVPQVNRAGNLSMSQAGQESQTIFHAAEFVRMKCDVHPWMTAWVGVFENPFFAVTQDDGSFRISNVPAGTFKLVAWHELYGRREQSVSITNDKPIEMEFSFGRPGSS